MKAKIDSLEATQKELQKDMKTVLALANQSKGAFFFSMSLAAFVGGVVSMIIKGWGQ